LSGSLTLTSVELCLFATLDDTVRAQEVPVRLKDFGIQEPCSAPTDAERSLKVAPKRHEDECRQSKTGLAQHASRPL